MDCISSSLEEIDYSLHVWGSYISSIISLSWENGLTEPPRYLLSIYNGRHLELSTAGCSTCLAEFTD